MSAEVDITVVTEPIRGIPVAATAVDVVPINGPCQLYGWSFRESTGELPGQGAGTVASPGAGATIATTAALPAGTYDVSWQVELQGAAAAADANNFQLVDSAGVVVGSINPGAAGIFPQEDVEVTTTAAGAILVRAIAAGTVGVAYSAQVSALPEIGPACTVELQDGNQPLGESSMQAQGTDTQTLPGDGLKVSQQVKVHVIQGTVSGVLYARFEKFS